MSKRVDIDRTGAVNPTTCVSVCASVDEQSRQHPFFTFDYLTSKKIKVLKNKRTHRGLVLRAFITAPLTFPGELPSSRSDTSSSSFSLFSCSCGSPLVGPAARNPGVETASESRERGWSRLRSTSETGVVVIQVIPSLYVDHPTLIPPQ